MLLPNPTNSSNEPHFCLNGETNSTRKPKFCRYLYTTQPCNEVLCVSTIVFSLFALSVFVDPKITLLSGIELWQPTFLYAYVALLLQCGILQAIGCLGALRLNQKLLNTYWYILLVLMIGDIIVGLVWVFRLDKIKITLNQTLRQRLIDEYGSDEGFTKIWNWVQENEQCCGVDSPMDFQHINDSSYHYDLNGFSQESGSTTAIPGVFAKLPSSCCTFTRKDTNDPEDPQFQRSQNNFQAQRQGGQSWESYSSGGDNSEETNRDSSSSKKLKQNFNYNNRRIPYRHAAHDLLGSDGPLQGNNNNLPQHPMKQPFSSTSQHILHQRRRNKIQQSQNQQPIPGVHIIGGQHFIQTTTESSNSVSNSVCELPPHYLMDNSLPTRPPHYFSSSEEDTYSSSSSPHDSHSHDKSSKSYRPSTTGPRRFLDGPHTHLSILMELQVHKHGEGCGEKVLDWLNQSTDILFVIGFCIIVFLKGCFLTILRYEIKEMIQKIHLLNDEGVSSAAMNELIGLTSMYNESQDDGGEGGGGGGGGENEANCGNCNEMGRNGEGRQSIVGNSILVPGGKPHGNHVGNNTAGQPGIVAIGIPPKLHHRIEIDDDFDSSSTLLRRVSTKKKKEKKNGNNNNSNSNPAAIANATTAAVDPKKNPNTATSTH